MKYVWAAYKKNVFDNIFKSDLRAKEFSAIFADYCDTVYNYAWVLGDQPVGVVFGVDLDKFIILDRVYWFPWATSRQITENAVNFLNTVRKENNYVWSCEEKDKRFYEYIARHGIIRRVGTLQSMNHARLWETRK